MFDFFSRSKKLTNKKNILCTNSYIDTNNLIALYSFIEKKSGIELNKNKSIIKQKIISFCLQNNINSFTVLLESIKEDEMFFKEFVTVITINETYFFREREQIIHALEVYNKKLNQCLDILCLPSATGEEVYSVVIDTLEMGFKNFKIVGADIDKNAIKKAQVGVYKQRALHKVNKDILLKYFDVKGTLYRTNRKLKEFVSFKECNIFEENLCHLGTFDIIFSRNMFIYFNDEKKIEAYKCLKQLRKNSNSKIYLGHADISSSLDEYISSTK